MAEVKTEASPSVGNALFKRAMILLGVLAIAVALLLTATMTVSAAEPTKVYVQPGAVSGTWTSDNEYIVTGSIFIDAGTTLTINPGTTVRFNNYTALQVNGTLVANALGKAPVVFTSNYSQWDTSSVLSWNGIYVIEGGAVQLNTVEIHHAYTGVGIANGTATLANLVINDTAWGIDWHQDFVATSISLTNLTINGFYEYGMHIQNPDQAVTFSLTDSTLIANAGAETAIYIESIDTWNGTVDASFDGVTITGGQCAVEAFGAMDVVIDVVDSEFGGQMDVSIAGESLFGSVVANVESSTITGAGSDSPYWMYSVKEIPYEYELLARDPNDLDNWTWSNGAFAELHAILPWDFPFAGEDYTDIYMNSFGNVGIGPYVGLLAMSEYLTYDTDGGSTFFGYKIYEDHAVFQFSVSVPGDDQHLNVFEYVLYPDGSIQYNYNVMEIETYNVIALRSPSDTIFYDWILGNGNDQDYKSYLITGTEMGPGSAMALATDEGDISVSIVDSTITGFMEGGIYGTTLFGDIDLLMTGSEMSYIYGDDDFGAIYMDTDNGTMDMQISDNTFNKIFTYSYVFESTCFEGGNESVVVENNVFNDVAYVGFVYTYVWHAVEDDTYDYAFDSERVFQNNVLTNSGMVESGLYFWNVYDAVWNVTFSQIVINNTWTSPLYWGAFPFLADTDPYTGAMYETWFYAYNWEGTDSQMFDYELIVQDNTVEIPAIVGYDGDTYTWFPSFLTAFTDVDMAGGSNEVSTVYDVSNNTVTTAGDTEYMVYVYDWADGSENDLTKTTMVSVVDNSFVSSYDYISGAYGYGVYVFTGFWFGDNIYEMATVTSDTTIEITGNYFEDLGVAAEIYTDSYVENCYGTSDITETVWFNDNELVFCEGAVYMQNWFEAYFSNYFPYWPMVVNQTSNVAYDYQIMNNIGTDVGVDDGWNDEVIYVDTEAYFHNMGDSIFADIFGTIDGSLDISGNNMTVISGDANDVTVYAWFWTEGRTASIEAASSTVVSNNIFDNYDSTEDDNNGIYVEIGCGAYASSTRDSLLDTPSCVVIADVEINENVLNGTEDGIYLEIEPEVQCGASYSELVLNAAINDNIITGNSDDGILIGYNGWVMYGDYTVATLNTDINVDAIGNQIDGVLESDMYGFNIWGGIEWEAMDEFADYTMVNLTGEFNINVFDNDCVNGEDGLDASFDEYWGNVAQELIVEANTFTATEAYGIWLDGGHVQILDNVLYQGYGYGLYAEYICGEISGNVISYFAETGMYIEHSEDLLVADNEISYCGIGSGVTSVSIDYEIVGMYLYDLYNVSVSGNSITECAYGMYGYYLEECSITGNNVDYNGDGAYFDEIYMVLIEDNTFNYNDGDGVWLVDSDEVVFGNNTVSHNLGYGLYVDNDNGRIYLWNGEFSYNGYDGLIAYTYYSPYLADPLIDITDFWYGVHWFVDADALVAQNDVDFNGEIVVLAGGMLSLNNVDYFYFDGSSVDGTASMIVEESGTLDMLYTSMYSDYGYYEFQIFGTLTAKFSSIVDAYEVYLAPTSTAEMRGCMVSGVMDTAVHVDDCAPVLSECVILGNTYGVLIEGVDADPTVVGCLIMGACYGIYGKDTNLGGVYDNIILLNSNAGIYAEDVTGRIHDNTMMLNKVEILLLNSEVTIEDNEIGWTIYMDALAEYAPLIETVAHHMYQTVMDALSIVDINLNASDLEDLMGEMPYFAPYYSDYLVGMLAEAVIGHVGVVAEDSYLEMKGNTYGMLYQCVYVIGSTVLFGDQITTRMLSIPYFIGLDSSELEVKVQNVNGLYAVDSTVVMDGAEISVVDDAITLEGTDLEIKNSVLNAGGFDIFAYGGSEISVWGTSLDKVKSEDSNSITVYCKLEVTAVDANGDVVSDAKVVIRDGKGVYIANGTTDANGKFTTQVVYYKMTSDGKDTTMNPYNVEVKFYNGKVSKDVSMTDDVNMVEIVGEKDNLPLFMGIVVLGLIGLMAVIVLVKRRK